MSINPFLIPDNNPFTINNSSLLSNNNNNNNQQNTINSIFNSNISNNLTNKNQNQIQQSSGNNNFSSLNIFNNKSEISSNIKSSEINKKNDNNNSLNSFSFLNQNKNNIFSNLNKEEQKSNSILNQNSKINTNINTNKDNINNTAFNFFNINAEKDKKTEASIINSKNEEKKEPNNIFLAQSNNLLNKINNANDNNENKNKEKKEQLNIDNDKNKNKPLMENLSLNALNKDEKKEVNEFLNNLLIEDKLVLGNKDMIEYEKKQLFAKLGGEIIDEFKAILNSDKEEFQDYVHNSRLLEEKFYKTSKIVKKNIENSVQKEIRYNNILSNLNTVSQNANILNTKISNRNKNISDALDFIMNNNNGFNNNLNINYIKRTDFEENNSIYKDLKDISKNVRKIDDDLNIILNTMDKNAKNENDTQKLLYEQNLEKKGNNNEMYSFNNNIGGVWIKRNNMENNIYVDQKEINEIFNDCYNGLNSLISETETFNEIYNKLKSKLLDKINKNNNLESNQQDNNSDFINKLKTKFQKI